MIPRKYSSILFGLIVSMLMTLIVSGVSTFNNIKSSDDFLYLWLDSWYKSWIIAFPIILIVSPLAKKIVQKITR